MNVRIHVCLGRIFEGKLERKSTLLSEASRMIQCPDLPRLGHLPSDFVRQTINLSLGGDWQSYHRFPLSFLASLCLIDCNRCFVLIESSKPLSYIIGKTYLSLLQEIPFK